MGLSTGDDNQIPDQEQPTQGNAATSADALNEIKRKIGAFIEVHRKIALLTAEEAAVPDRVKLYPKMAELAQRLATAGLLKREGTPFNASDIAKMETGEMSIPEGSAAYFKEALGLNDTDARELAQLRQDESSIVSNGEIKGIRAHAARLRGDPGLRSVEGLRMHIDSLIDQGEAQAAAQAAKPAAAPIVAAGAGVAKYLAQPELIEMAKIKPGKLLADYRKATMATAEEKAARPSMQDKLYLLPKEMVARLKKAGVQLQEDDGVKLENGAIRIKEEDIGSYVAALSLNGKQVADFTAAVQEAGFAYDAAEQIAADKLQNGVATPRKGPAPSRG